MLTNKHYSKDAVNSVLIDLRAGILTPIEIGKKHDIPAPRVREWRRNNNITAKTGQYTEEEKKTVLDDLQKCILPPTKLAKKHGIKVQTLRAWMVKYNITKYNRGLYNHISPKDVSIMKRMPFDIAINEPDILHSEIAKRISKEYHSVHPSTISRWFVDRVDDEIKTLITGWKRSKQLSNYIEELKCLA